MSTVTPGTIGPRLKAEVLDPMKRDFVGKTEIIDLLGICLLGGENLFILGPPGTAKSALVQSLGQRLHGQTFSYLLTRFTEPNELFGPFDIRKLREGELITNKEGMLSEASLVFLDELLNANSAILNSLLSALNERIVFRGRERIPVRALMFAGASNHLPEDDALQALFDRFLLRVHCNNVPGEQLAQVLEAGWRLDSGIAGNVTLGFEDIRAGQGFAGQIDLAPIRTEYVALIQRIRQAGILVSDRRAVKLQKLVAASAVLCGRNLAMLSDLWILRYIWDADDQQEVLRSLVDEVVAKDQQEGDGLTKHPQANHDAAPDAEALARDLVWIETRWKAASADSERAVLRDRVAILNGQVHWVTDNEARQEISKRLEALWSLVGKEPRAAEPAIAP